MCIPSSLSTAFCASSAYLYRTKAKPLDSPVLNHKRKINTQIQSSNRKTIYWNKYNKNLGEKDIIQICTSYKFLVLHFKRSSIAPPNTIHRWSKASNSHIFSASVRIRKIRIKWDYKQEQYLGSSSLMNIVFKHNKATQFLRKQTCYRKKYTQNKKLYPNQPSVSGDENVDNFAILIEKRKQIISARTYLN